MSGRQFALVIIFIAPDDENMTNTISRTHHLLLMCGALAAPIWILTALVQGLTRDGFDFTRHPISMLALGDPGWIQIACFVVTGLLTLAAAYTLRGDPWPSRLLAIQGAGLIVSGFFTADEGFAFPPGTPDVPGTLSGHGAVHMVASGLSFIATIIFCYVMARRFTGLWALAGRVGGAALAVGFVWAGSAAPGGPLALFIGLSLAWGWVAATIYNLIKK